MIKYIGYIIAISILVIIFYTIKSQFREHMLQNDPILPLIKDILLPLQSYFDTKYPDANIDLKNLKLYKGDSSYTLNKDQIFLCLYDENSKYYPISMLIHVILHELAHKANTYDIGHTPTFHKIFDDIQDEATRLKIYNPDIPPVKNYCGT